MTYTNENIKDIIIEKFSKVAELGKTEDNTGTYSHQDSKSGIGCAIGCLLEPAQAEELQIESEKTGRYGIVVLYNYALETDNQHILTLLKPIGDISINLLRQFQFLHDDSYTVEQFLERMSKLDVQTLI